MISIVIPAYNCEPYLEQAIRSIQAQTYQDLEVVLVNDGSTDDTQRLAERLAQDDSRILVINQLNSGGPAQPRNLGISRSHGEYICFLDPDDYFYPEKIERQLRLLIARPDIDMVFCDMNRVDTDGIDLGKTFLERVSYMKDAITHLDQIGPVTYITRPSFLAFSSARRMGISTGSVMIRRQRLEDLDTFFPLDLVVGEDIDLWFRILLKSKSAFINAPLYAYRIHSASLMHDEGRVTKGLFMTHARNYGRVCHRLSLAQKVKYRRRIAGLMVGIGYQRRLEGDDAGARMSYLKSLVWYPHFGTMWAFCKAFVPRSFARK